MRMEQANHNRRFGHQFKQSKRFLSCKLEYTRASEETRGQTFGVFKHLYREQKRDQHESEVRD